MLNNMNEKIGKNLRNNLKTVIEEVSCKIHWITKNTALLTPGKYELLLSLVQTNKTQWAKFRDNYFHGRSDGQLKNLYNLSMRHNRDIDYQRIIKSKKRREKTASRNTRKRVNYVRIMEYKTWLHFLSWIGWRYSRIFYVVQYRK
jgi:hypothetical protein